MFPTSRGRGRLPLTHQKDKEMTKQEQNDKIDQAVELLHEVALAQSTVEEFCETCQAPEYVDWVSFKLGDNLKAQCRKLRKMKWADLEAEPETRAPGRR